MKTIIFLFCACVLLTSCASKNEISTTINTNRNGGSVGVGTKENRVHISKDTLSIGTKRIRINNRW